MLAEGSDNGRGRYHGGILLPRLRIFKHAQNVCYIILFVYYGEPRPRDRQTETQTDAAKFFTRSWLEVSPRERALGSQSLWRATKRRFAIF